MMPIPTWATASRSSFADGRKVMGAETQVQPGARRPLNIRSPPMNIKRQSTPVVRLLANVSFLAVLAGIAPGYAAQAASQDGGVPATHIRMSGNDRPDSLAPHNAEDTWACPMHPEIHRHEPGKCPVCMAGVAYLAERPPGVRSDGIVQSAQASDRIEPLDGTASIRKMWVCPMHPNILQDHPGSCPICGMDLVETGAAHDHRTAGIQVDTALQQRMGMRLADVTTHRMNRAVHTYGNVGIDETSLYSISPKIDGWIRKLHVSAPGQQVTAGQILYEIYSPELVQRQREFIELLQRRDQLLENMTDYSGQNAQMAASLARERIRTREKFAYADVGAATLAAIESTRRTVDRLPEYAARSGFVTQLGVT